MFLPSFFSKYRSVQVSLLFICFFNASISGAQTISVDQGTTYQTVTGWEALMYSTQEHPSFALFAPAAFDSAINAGFNRIRLEVRSGVENTQDYYSQYKAGTLSNTLWRCYRYSTVNDNSNSSSINAAGFHFTDFDDNIEKVVIPFRQKLMARGESLYINLNYVAFVNQMTATGCPAGLQYNHDDTPAEYAEFILATFKHMQSKYGFVPDALEVILEPDLTPFWRGKQIGEAIVATNQLLTANGFNIKFIGPSPTTAANAPIYFDEMKTQVPAAVPLLSEISYHRYVPPDNVILGKIATRAVQNNLVGGAMLEWWDGRNSFETLHQDLELGRNTAWQQGAIAVTATDATTAISLVNVSNPSSPTVTWTDFTKYSSHYFRYVRKGAVRIGATSSNTNLKTLAFKNTNGKIVVVGYNKSGAGSISLTGLTAGDYGITYSNLNNSSIFNQSLPDVTVTQSQNLNFVLPAAGVFSVYAKSGTVNPTPTPTPTPDRLAPSAPTNLMSN